jgi:putative hydrolase of the HAD superfamily
LHSLGLGGLFHAIANSSEIGAAKPDARFFEAALQIAGVAAAEALFVDDSRTNVEAAARLGIRSHQFSGPAGMARFLQEAGAIRENAG